MMPACILHRYRNLVVLMRGRKLDGFHIEKTCIVQDLEIIASELEAKQQRTLTISRKKKVVAAAQRNFY